METNISSSHSEVPSLAAWKRNDSSSHTPNIFLSRFTLILLSYLTFYHRNITAVLSEKFAQSKRKPITFCHFLGIIRKWETHKCECTIYYGHVLLESAYYSF